MLPHLRLRDVQRHELQRARGAGVATPEVGGDEALHACDGVCKPDLQIITRAGEGRDDDVLAVKGGGEFFDGEGIGDAYLVGGGWVGGF
jgi:hypothetical protein